MNRTKLEEKIAVLRQQLEQAKAQANALAGALQFAETLLTDNVVEEAEGTP